MLPFRQVARLTFDALKKQQGADHDILLSHALSDYSAVNGMWFVRDIGERLVSTVDDYGTVTLAGDADIDR